MLHSPMHALYWIDRFVVRGFLNMYLDSHAADTRTTQLKEATAWMVAFKEKVHQTGARDGINYQMEWVYGGDRNFTTAPEQRLTSSSSGTWHACTRFLRAWQSFEAAMGHGNVIDQPEFTWKRVARSRHGRLDHWKQILDVVGISAEHLRYVNFIPVFDRIGNIPHPRASDHWPVSIEFPRGEKRRWRAERGAQRYHTYQNGYATTVTLQPN